MSEQFLSICPFPPEAITEAIQALERAGIAFEDTEYILTVLGDSVIGTGSGVKQFKSAVKLFAEVYYRGFITQRDLNNFKGRGSIYAYGVLLEKTGLTHNAYTALTARGIPTEQALPLLLEGLEGRYRGSMAQYIEGIIERHNEAENKPGMENAEQD